MPNSKPRAHVKIAKPSASSIKEPVKTRKTDVGSVDTPDKTEPKTVGTYIFETIALQISAIFLGIFLFWAIFAAKWNDIITSETLFSLLILVALPMPFLVVTIWQIIHLAKHPDISRHYSAWLITFLIPLFLISVIISGLMSYE